MVDLVSDGRVDLGLGAGYRVPSSSCSAPTRGALRPSPTLWSPSSARSGPRGRVTPAPVQPRIPIWLGYQGPKGARRAGKDRRGAPVGHRPRSPALRRRSARGRPRPRRRVGMAGSFQGFVTEDPERDWPVVSRHARLPARLVPPVHGRRHWRGGAEAGRPRACPQAATPTRPLRRSSTAHPTRLLARDVARTRAARPVETVFFWVSIGGMSEALCVQHVQTLCTQLAPLHRQSPRSSAGLEDQVGGAAPPSPSSARSGCRRPSPAGPSSP